MDEQFVTTRADGRSNIRVICDLVAQHKPGDLVPFGAIIEALDVGSAKSHSVVDARGAVARATVRLLKEQSTAMVSVRTQGYRVAEASRHRMIAQDRRHRSEVQLRRGLQVLQHVRWDEMDPQTRAAHEGTLMIVSALYEQQRATDKRQEKIEAMLERLMAQQASS